MLKRREECDTYLPHICIHRWSRKSLVKRWNIMSFQPTLWLSSAVDVDCSLYFIFSQGSFCCSDVCKCESGIALSLLFNIFLELSVLILHCLCCHDCEKCDNILLQYLFILFFFFVQIVREKERFKATPYNYAMKKTQLMKERDMAQQK